MLLALSISAIAALVLTKAADLWTTWKHVGASGESNPVGRFLFQRVGVPAGLAAVGLAALLIIAATWSLAFVLGDVAVAFLIPWSLGVAAIQGAVAHHNATGRPNLVTVRVMAFHAWWARGRR